MAEEKSEAPEEVTTRLPLPEPTPEAVEAGIFGVCADGGFRPSRREILELVAAQVDELVQLVLEIAGYVRAEKTGVYPVSGRTTQSDSQKEKNRQSARRRAQAGRTRFQAHLDAYEGAFGPEACAQLREFVLAAAATLMKPQPSALQQLDLF